MPAGGSRKPPALIHPTSLCMSIGVLPSAVSCAAAIPYIADRAPLSQNAAVMLEASLRPRCETSPFVSMEVILAFAPCAGWTRCTQCGVTRTHRLGRHVLDNNSSVCRLAASLLTPLLPLQELPEQRLAP